jgi:hypothetical protein
MEADECRTDRAGPDDGAFEVAAKSMGGETARKAPGQPRNGLGRTPLEEWPEGP